MMFNHHALVFQDMGNLWHIFFTQTKNVPDR